MIDARIQHGYNNSHVKLVHVTVKGIVTEPYPKSFYYNNEEGSIGWRDQLTVDPHIVLPQRVQKFLKKDPFILCVLGFRTGYAELLVHEQGEPTWNWHTGA